MAITTRCVQSWKRPTTIRLWFVYHWERERERERERAHDDTSMFSTTWKETDVDTTMIFTTESRNTHHYKHCFIILTDQMRTRPAWFYDIDGDSNTILMWFLQQLIETNKTKQLGKTNQSSRQHNNPFGIFKLFLQDNSCENMNKFKTKKKSVFFALLFMVYCIISSNYFVDEE